MGGGQAACQHQWGDAGRKTTIARPDHSRGEPLESRGEQGSAAAAGLDVSLGGFCALCGAWRGCLGLEPTPELYVEHMVEVFREVRRVLRDDGTLWLNLGDSYSHGGCGAKDEERWPKAAAADNMPRHAKRSVRAENVGEVDGKHPTRGAGVTPLERVRAPGLKPKDLVGIPWRVAFALQADGWWLRMDVVWHKPNAMPESVTDRPTKAHEYVFLMSKSERYFYDAKAIREQVVESGRGSGNKERFVATEGERSRTNTHLGSSIPWQDDGSGRNKRSVWSVATRPFGGAHFAVMPEDLAEPCVLAGAPPGGVVLDPFGGSGTVGRVAARHGRRAILCDLNTEYLALQVERTTGVQVDLLTSRGLK